jgi:predicted RNA-binding Zn-ribbon protein involved in translation (DUF1610 family)
MIILVCSNCNTEVEVEFLDDITDCPNCGLEISKENASAVGVQFDFITKNKANMPVIL